MTNTGLWTALAPHIETILQGTGSREERMAAICQHLHDAVPHYHWVGFYMVDPQKPRELLLGPYVGAPTDHVRIPFGKGICGQAAEREETFVIQDVSQEDNYLSCSIDVKSEIVVPMFLDGQVIGQIDIDSHDLAPFTDADRICLENVCRMVAELYRR